MVFPRFNLDILQAVYWNYLMSEAGLRPNPVNQIVDALGLLFSITMLAGINIVISGHLLGFVFNLETSGKDHFSLRIPFVLHFRVTGRQVAAGFTAFSVSLLSVGIFLSEIAHDIFINNLQATENHWLACLALAACISVITCLILSAIRMIFFMLKSWWYNRNKPSAPTPEEQVRRIIS